MHGCKVASINTWPSSTHPPFRTPPPGAIPAFCVGSGFKPFYRLASTQLKTKSPKNNNDPQRTPKLCGYWCVFAGLHSQSFNLQPETNKTTKQSSRENAGTVSCSWPFGVLTLWRISKPRPILKNKQNPKTAKRSLDEAVGL